MTQLRDLFTRLAAPVETPVVKAQHMNVHLQNQILLRDMQALGKRVNQLSAQVNDLFDVVLHAQTGQPPDPKTIQRLMRK